MKDGSLQASYVADYLYYCITDCKKVAIKGMKKVFEYADEMMAKIKLHIVKEQKAWDKAFLKYPEHTI